MRCRVSASVRKQRLERYLGVHSPVHDLASICADQELRIFVEEGAARDTASWTLWHFDTLSILKIHLRSVHVKRHHAEDANVEVQVFLSLVLV